jgi:tetratricopeptide (TPR) repeat protein
VDATQPKSKFLRALQALQAVAEKETIIAILMALIAMLGMVTAYRTATAEEEVLLKEGRLTQSRFLELTKREEALVRFADSARFEVAREIHLRKARDLQERAEKAGPTDRGKGSLLELQAQEEVALARIQQPYLNFLELPGTDDKGKPLAISQIVDRFVAEELAASGLGSKWSKNAGSIWQSLKEQIGKSQKKLVGLALTVVVFVVALGCLSLAELWCQRRSLRLQMIALGIVVTLAAAFWATHLDHIAGLYFLGCMAVFVILSPLSKLMRGTLQRVSQELATRMGFMSVDEAEESGSLHPPETELRLFAGARMHLESPKNPFTCFVVLLIVLAVLCSAWVGYRYTLVSIEADKSAERVVEYAANGLKSSHTTSVYFELGMLAAVQERRARYQAALQQHELSQNRSFGIDKGVTDEILYNATHDVSPKDDSDKDVTKMLDGEDGPEHARHYPKELILGRTMFGQECGFALSDAMDEQSLRWRNKAHWYLAGITMFAIALYLFGQSLSMGRNEETWTLVFFGLIVVAVGIGLAAAEGAQRISSAEYTADACDKGNAKSGDAAVRAAVQYAWGVSDLEIHDYESSVKELEEAVTLRPRFLSANFYLSQAAKNMGNPQSNEGFMNMIPEARIAEAVNHEKAALDGFAKNSLEESPVMLGNYGFDTYLYGLVKRDRTLVKKGLKSSEDAITHDHEGQFLYLPYNVAVAELALGDMKKGLEMYSKTATRPGMKNDGDLVAGAVGDLETLYHYCEGLNSKDYCKEIQSKEPSITLELAAAAWPAPETVKGVPVKAALRNVVLQVDPSGLRWQAQPVNFKLDDGTTTLSVLWYTREPGSSAWRVLSKVSGKVEPKEVTQDENGEIHQLQSYLEATGMDACLPAGDYRADFYLNGVPFYVTSEPLDTPSAMRASPFKDLNLALCRPNGWSRWRPGSDEPVIAGGYVDNKDRPTQGIFLFDFYYPKTLWDVTRAEDLVSRARAYLASKKIMSASEFQDEPNACTIDLKGQTMIRQRSPSTGETILARIWPAKDGSVHVALGYTHSATVNGTSDTLGDKGVECNSLRSVREIYDVAP